MSKLIGIAAVLSAVWTAVTAVTWSNIHPFSIQAYGLAVIAVAMGMFAGYAFTALGGGAAAKPQDGGSAGASQEPDAERGES